MIFKVTYEEWPSWRSKQGLAVAWSAKRLMKKSRYILELSDSFSVPWTTSDQISFDIRSPLNMTYGGKIPARGIYRSNAGSSCIFSGRYKMEIISNLDLNICWVVVRWNSSLVDIQNTLWLIFDHILVWCQNKFVNVVIWHFLIHCSSLVFPFS